MDCYRPQNADFCKTMPKAAALIFSKAVDLWKSMPKFAE